MGRSAPDAYVTSRTLAQTTLRPLVTLRRAMDGGSTLAWLGEDAARMEVARAERHGGALTAEGTQLGAVYEVRYRLESELLSDFFDLAYSPLQLAPGHAGPPAGKRQSAHLRDALGRRSVA